MPRGVKTGLMTSAHLLEWGVLDLAATQQPGLLQGMHLTTLENKSRNQS